MLPVGILCPGIESPIGECYLSFVFNEDRAGIARPDAIGWPDVELHPLDINMAEAQDFLRRLFFTRRSHNEIYIFHTHQMPDDISKDPRDRLELARHLVRVEDVNLIVAS